jgi:Sulfotransferase family
MPNPLNVDAPIILIGAGRSGTSLVSRIFDLHPDCSTVGETANLIFGTWEAVALSSASIAPLIEADAWVPEETRAGRVVRQAFLSCFSDDKPRWMQKPIGVPKALGDRFEDVWSDKAGAWYWRVMRSAFPRARYVAIVRHPCDAVLSGRSKWGFSERSLWNALATIGAYLTPPVRHVVRYEDLVGAPEPTVRALCQAVDLTFEPAMLDAFRDIHVPAPGRADPAQSGFSRQDEWTMLEPSQLEAGARRLITETYERLAGGLEWPAHLRTEGAPRPPEADASAGLDPRQVEIGRLGVRLEQLMVDHAYELGLRDQAWQRREQELFAKQQRREHEFAARERELAGLWAEQKAWIEQLEKVKLWLEQQVANWRRLAEERRGPDATDADRRGT